MAAGVLVIGAGVLALAALKRGGSMSSSWPIGGYSKADFEVTSTGLPNEIPPELEPNAIGLAQMLARHGSPGINSAYRSPDVNGAVGGSSTSDHLKALAADVQPYDRTRGQLAIDLLENEPTIDQVIYYYDRSHLHIGKAPEGSAGRGQALYHDSTGYHTWSPSPDDQ